MAYARFSGHGKVKTLTEINQLVLYTESRSIVRFINEHPFNLYGEYREQTNRGGLADKMPPVKIVNLFLELLGEKKGLFTQQEFIDYSLLQLNDWIAKMIKEVRNPAFRAAFGARLGRNFYMSLMKQLHVSSFCIELGWFDRIWWDAVTDASSKHDLIATTHDKPHIAIDLLAGSQKALEAYRYKQQYRQSNGSSVSKSYPVLLDIRRHSPGGNAIWYCPKDFEHIVIEYCHDDSLWGHPAIPCYWKCHNNRTSRYVNPQISIEEGMQKAREKPSYALPPEWEDKE